MIHIYILLSIIIFSLFYIIYIFFTNNNKSIKNYLSSSEVIYGIFATIIAIGICYCITKPIKNWSKINPLIKIIVETLIILISKEIILSLIFNQYLVYSEWLVFILLILVIQICYSLIIRPYFNLYFKFDNIICMYIIQYIILFTPFKHKVLQYKI